MFGKFLGIQVFAAPITLFYLIKSESILRAGTSLLSFKIHYLPLLVFLIMLAFMLFMLIKLKLIQRGSADDYLDSVIQLNLSMLVLVIIALIIYAVSGFLAYFYGIRGTLKHSIYLLFKLYTSLLILYYYLLNHLLNVDYISRRSRRRAMQYIRAWSMKHKFLFLRYILFLALVIMAITRLYILLVHFVLVPVLTGIKNYAGIDLRFSLAQFFTLKDVFMNVAVLVGAFLISNLLIYPLILISETLIKKYLPFNIIIGINNAQTTQ